MNLAHAFDSNILSAESPKFTKLLGEWLPVTGNWSVCWTATKDGNDSKIFHHRCDSKAPTLTVVKVLKDKKTFIFGGFATANWTAIAGKTLYNVAAPGSFLFSFRNNDNLAAFKSHNKVSAEKTAISKNPKSGPYFGFGPDLAIYEEDTNQPILKIQSIANLGGSYEAPSGYSFKDIKTQSLLAGSLYFTPAEVEVLYLN